MTIPKVMYLLTFQPLDGNLDKFPILDLCAYYNQLHNTLYGRRNVDLQNLLTAVTNKSITIEKMKERINITQTAIATAQKRVFWNRPELNYLKPTKDSNE